MFFYDEGTASPPRLRPLFIDRNTAMNLQKFARHPLTFGPSPITALPRLSAHLGGKVHLYAKREDCNSGLAFGGNKTRKLEYLIPEAIAGGYDTLVSICLLYTSPSPRD